MNLMIAFIPAVAWGIIPLYVSLVKHSEPANQILGIGLGAPVVGLVLYLIQRPHLTWGVSGLAMLSGAFWTIGQLGQFISYQRIGVSNTMPISTGLQLVGNTIIGVVIFGEWRTANQYLLGTIALILIIVGVALTAISQNSTKRVRGQDVLFLVVTTLGYLVYSSFPKTVSAGAQSLLLPQTVGIFVGASLYVLLTKRPQVFGQRATWLDLVAGLLFGIGMYSYIMSAQVNGVTSAFIYSQLSVIISTLGGMTILKEFKQGQELLATLAGLALIIVGAAL